MTAPGRVAERHALSRENVRRVNRIANPIEGIALCQEVAASVERLQGAIASRSWEDVNDEALLLGRRATAYSEEFRRLAAAIEAGA